MGNKKNMVTPLFDALVQFSRLNTISFHVPGHKNGSVFPSSALPFFKSILELDKTELTGLDDLHAAEGVIEAAQQLAAEYFRADQTFFLVGGSTAGNLAMILTVCSPGDTVIVQRNSHKSILNGLELSGAKPVFVAPEFDEVAGRYGAPSPELLIEALKKHPDAKGLILTYPDYFGSTASIQKVVERFHQKNIPVLIDEAHGVHFPASDQFPASAIELGADVVVHSAHKMAPAMTMASFLHVQSNLVSSKRIAHYLQLIQSSSPSYPLLASLDLARAYLASLSEKDITEAIESAAYFRKVLQVNTAWRVLWPKAAEDPLKIILVGEKGFNMKEVASLFEKEGIYPELATESQILFIHGLAPFKDWHIINKALENMEEPLKNIPRHATIETRRIPQQSIQQLELSYEEMRNKPTVFLLWSEAVGEIAAESVIPYPPGIPLISRGERLTTEMISQVNEMVKQGINFQNKRIKHGVEVFSSGQNKGESS